ncbi:large conductance mechanosensitive channel protein MscL [Halobacillus salinarum]|uniref:Large-conductance mechanosensitive channel n=1 Tax=Halobacillus salinarum TaxID=2932257 RepID=A0ABY4EKB5_9BACI|nr:large conductance mechanosensitive channel protein MscL [Halobacillus salinarum]UOQ44487.1 large conductance mechanosensitive channel protein MscL [Halobacillus salinarum]
MDEVGLLKEFRQFTVKGSALDIGVGMVLGAAFSGFIDSLVKDILLPPVGLFFSTMNIENLFISLTGKNFPSLMAAQEAGAATINYGLFLTTVVRFIIVLFSVFLIVRQLNRWKKPHQHPLDAMTKKECEYCCMPIPSRAAICPNCSSTLTESLSPKWKVK